MDFIVQRNRELAIVLEAPVRAARFVHVFPSLADHLTVPRHSVGFDKPLLIDCDAEVVIRDRSDAVRVKNQYRSRLRA